MGFKDYRRFEQPCLQRSCDSYTKAGTDLLIQKPNSEFQAYKSSRRQRSGNPLYFKSRANAGTLRFFAEENISKMMHALCGFYLNHTGEKKFDKKQMNPEKVSGVEKLTIEDLCDVNGGISREAESLFRGKAIEYKRLGKNKEEYLHLMDRFNNNMMRYFNTNKPSLRKHMERYWEEEQLNTVDWGD